MNRRRFTQEQIIAFLREQEKRGTAATWSFRRVTEGRELSD